MGFLFVFFWITESKLAEQGNILWTGGFVGKTLLLSLALGALLGSLLCTLLYLAAGRVQSPGKPDRLHGRRSGKTFLLSLLLTAAAWFPAYLAYYPAICAYDSPVQTGQVVENYFIDHHPIAHTLLIKWAMRLGEGLFRDANTGVGIYTLLQLLFLAGAFAFCMTRLYRAGVRTAWLVLVQLFFMFFPFHLYMSVSMTKDTIFSAFFVLQMVSLYELLGKGQEEKKVSWRELLFFFSTLGMILFRNNGKFAFLVLLGVLVLMLLFGKKSRKRFFGLLLWSAAAFLAGNLALTGIYHATNAQQGDRREMLSIPIQQLARCMLYHGGAGVLPEDDNTMEEVDKALINDFILVEGYRYYDPSLADPVKGFTNTYIVRYRTVDFLQTYFRLLGRYPGDFINAFLAVNAGYLYPCDVSHAYVNVEEGQTGMGYVQTHWEESDLNPRGLYKDSKWESLHEAMEQWADDNAYLKLPVLRYLFMPGIWLWLYLLLFGYLMIRREFGKYIPLSLILGYYVTLLLGPTVQLRYIYPVMIVFPFVALFCLGKAEGAFEGLSETEENCSQELLK